MTPGKPQVLQFLSIGHSAFIWSSLSSSMIQTDLVMCSSSHQMSGFPLGLENLEKWEGIFQSGKSQGILNRLREKSGKITQNTSGNLREILFDILVISK